MPDGKRTGASFLYEVHGDVPIVASRENQQEDLEGIMLLHNLWNHDQLPLLSALELFQAAAGQRHAQAIISLGTCVEVMTSAVIRELSKARGEPDSRWQGILETGLKNQFEHHLGRYAGIDVDLNDPLNIAGRWWLRGYDVRNAVVHAGHKPSPTETREAFDAGVALINEIGEQLRQDPVTERIGVQVQVKARPSF
jgi:hypothetical protein